MATRFDIIATRVIDVLDDTGKPSRQILVHIGRPSQEPTGEWSLPYQIVGIRKDRIFRVLGLDAVQALQLAHIVIGSVLASSDEAKQGRLRWNGHTDLGFPDSLSSPPE
ncbi:DUF6968 family protein [Sorangium sp. So ce131]|uniref:DUF6968 family protein n=1 Tax=Sorangium sp. So ce131 TaxID=3133282 RepID=UPI003F62C50B